jgi:hypothetical protein
MNRFVIALLAIFTAGPAWAQVRAVEIVQFGIYTADLKSSTRDSQGIKENISTNFRNAVVTTTVPAQLGVRFGMEFKVIGAPANQTVSLKKVWMFPPAGLRSPKVTQPIHRDETTMKANIETTTYTGWRFDDPWELVPGTWTLQLWYGDQKLAEKQFTIVAR